MAGKIENIFTKNGLTLSVAESCTGGLLSSVLTDVPGASKYFRAGLVLYTEEMKKQLLGVSASTIEIHGVISEETAREMAEKVRVLAGTDFSLSTTGNLGPDVLENKERGLICLAASRRGKTVSKSLMLRGDREENKEASTLSALMLIMEFVEEYEKSA